MSTFTDYLRNRFINWLMPDELSKPILDMLAKYAKYSAYAEGDHKRNLIVKANQADDNLTINFIELIIERSISMMFGKGIEFDLPGEDDAPQTEYLDSVWDANKKGIFLHKLAQFGSTYGTAFVKIVPDSLKQGEAITHRLIALHPAWMMIVTAPEDAERVDQYIIRYNVVMPDGQERARKEVTQRIYAVGVKESGEIYQTEETSHWTISNYYADKSTQGRWIEMPGSPVDWLYEFPPIHHWQNLPNAESCYGKSDIACVIEPQDRYNFLESNISKIVRYHAHPKTWGRGLSSVGKGSWGPDEMILANGETAMIANLEMQSDLASSRAFALDIRQAIFDLTRTVDMTSIADKLGALTNFGLRVLFMDSLNKNDTKRQLYGDGLSEVNRRLLIIGNMEPDTGKIVWPDPLPVNDVEVATALTQDLTNKLVSRQTASGKRGYNWTEEDERMQAEAASGDNVGAQILRAFGQGQQ